ncbi:b(0,+)-type amino acid transporter 1-like [Gigantopelta aegis]|uniref:b(0,+)-type amino acid transporter 1-like n=1 Tax=Gigantopelta aegis TaxID=1735272 RepID=UPI001B887A62|nr:b(0,+)-type amino acid transporter 1-like [Gigantopelta aegis]
MESSGVSTKRRTSCLAQHATTNGQPGVWVTRGSGQVDHEPKKVDFANLPAKSQTDEPILKEIGILYGGSLIASTIIGPGIFTSPKGVLEGAGSVGLSLVIWAACGVFSTLAALCFTELRESVKKEGVEYAYISEAFGPVVTFVYSWMRIAAAEPVGTAVFCVAFADYFADALFEGCGPPETLRTILAITALVSLAVMNAYSNKMAEQVQLLATVGKVTAVAFILIFGLMRLVQGHVSNLKTGFEGTKHEPATLAFAVYNGLWAYGGWSNVNHVTRGVKNPPRNLPRLVITVIPLVSIIYMLVVTSYFTVMTKEDMMSSNAIGVTFGARVLGKYAAVIPIGVGLTALGSANGTFLTVGRLSGVAVKDGYMPEVSSWIHVRSKTNITTLISRAVIGSVMIMVGSIGSLIRFFVFTVWVFHGLSVLALLVLRVKNKEKKRPYKVNIVIPIIVVSIIGAFTVAPFVGRPKPEFYASLVLLAISLLFYLQSKYLPVNPVFSEKITIILQLLLRIAPRSTLRVPRRLSLAMHRASIAIARRQSVAHNRRVQEEYIRRHSGSLIPPPSIKRSASSLSSQRRPSNVMRRNTGILKRSQTFTSARNSVRSTSFSPDTFSEKTDFTTSCDSGFSPNEDLLYTNGKPRTMFPDVEISISPPSEESLDSDFDADDDGSGGEDVQPNDAFGLGLFPIFTQGSLESSSSSESSSDEKQYESPSTSSDDDSDDLTDEDFRIGDDLSFIFIDKIHSSSTDDDLGRHDTRL